MFYNILSTREDIGYLPIKCLSYLNQGSEASYITQVEHIEAQHI